LPGLTLLCNIARMSVGPRYVKIAPSILSADFSRLGEQVEAVEEGGADAIHLDVMDGHFVPNITIGPLVVEAVRRRTSLPLHVHLMIDRPADYVSRFAAAGADFLIVHQENNWTLHRLLAEIGEANVTPGVALNPTTSVAMLEESVPFVELVLLMTVEPGFGGQQLIPTMYDKVARLRRFLAERGRASVQIEVDGGVNGDTASGLVASGADVLVAGAAVFSAGVTVGEALVHLRTAAESSLWRSHLES